MITDLNEASKEGDEKSFIVSRKDNQPSKPYCDYLRSTQNSSSFELMMRKNNQTALPMNKTVKISYRPQLQSHKKSTLSMKINSEMTDENPD